MRNFVVASLLLATFARAENIRIRVDATEAPRKLLHAHLTIPAKAGPLTLHYPEWIPGEHGPTGPIVNLTGLRFTAGGDALRWTRDPVNMFAFHIDVPSGATSVDVDLDYVDPVGSGQFSAGGSLTPKLGLISWNAVLLYPAAKSSDELTFEPSLKLPSGWKYATGLEGATENGDEIRFAPVSLTRLIDSPVLASSNLKRISLPSAASPFPHTIDLAADSDWANRVPDDFAAKYSHLVDEARAIFGAEHFRHYDWLVSMSNSVEHFGLEHHESSDDRVFENAIGDEQRYRDLAGLLAHEYSHSWNGKYRRPAGLAVANYDLAMKGELLWVYEGLTQYLGKLLPYRAGLWTPEYYRDSAALTATNLVNVRGRSWRPLEDTAVAAQILYGAPEAFRSWRRSVDFYDEGFLLWLDADMTIRKLTSNKKSLDDFLRRFYGGTDGDPVVKSYVFDDVVHSLNDVVTNDWASFLNQRLRSNATAPMGGIETSGWRIVYNDTPNLQQNAIEDRDESVDASNSLGFAVDEHGLINDVIPGTAAAKAGVVPGSTLVGVNGRRFSQRILRNAIRDSKTATDPMQLVFIAEDFVNVVNVDYHDGARYPHLERIANTTDWLTELGKARR